jgi:hypothetical protein
MRGFWPQDAEEPALSISPTFPYHTTPTPENWRALCADIEDHILFIQQGQRLRKQNDRFFARLRLYPRALRALYEVETKGGFGHAKTY